MAAERVVNAAARILIHAGMVLDGTGRRHAPGVLLVEDGRVVAAGAPQEIGDVGDVRAAASSRQSTGRGTAWLDLPDRVLIPALVNAHAHLDLSHIGPIPYTGDFVSWVDVVRDRRAVTTESICDSVRHGAKLALAGGTAIIGDIAGVGSLAAVDGLRESVLRGVSYIELFGQGPPERQAAALAVIRTVEEMLSCEENGVRIGLQPHAPYSCARSVYEAAASVSSAIPLATHLAETPEELEFTHSPKGSALAGLLAARGVWHDSITGYGCHPIEALADVLSQTPFVAAHLNYVDDQHIEMLAHWPITVAYCPRASAYFGHPRQVLWRTAPRLRTSSDTCHLTPDTSHHRYRDMLAAGVNVALGTDSILCLDTPDRISVLDEMRVLHRRDRTDPQVLLRMATIHGAKALGFDEGLVTFDEGPIAGVLAMRFDPSDARDPLAQVMARDDAPEWVIGP